MTECKECGQFLPYELRNRPSNLSPARYCSQSCRDRSHRRMTRHMHRARRAGCQVVERVDPVAIFKRDGWVCAICRVPAPRHLMGTDDQLAPTLDHRIPLRKGGHHTADNTRCAHSMCNYRRDQSWRKTAPPWMRRYLERDDQTISRGKKRR